MTRRVARAVTVTCTVARIVTVGMDTRTVARIVHTRAVTSGMARAMARGIPRFLLITLGYGRAAG